MSAKGTRPLIALLVAALTALALPQAAGACTQWHARTLLSGQGWLENLAFDGRGSITLSALVQGRILKLSRGGGLSTLVDSVFAPGGQALRGRFLYFNTGDTVGPQSAHGTVDRVDLRTGRRSTWAPNLAMPNGLLLLRNGDAIVSGGQDFHRQLTRVPARDPAHPQRHWAKVDGGNGLAVDPTGRWVYVTRTLSADGEIVRVSIAHPRRINVVARLGAGAIPDDMAIDRHGILYVAGFGSGKVYRVNPRRHTSCAIASGLIQPTSARFGGPGWNRRHLYVTDAQGHLSELAPGM
jgi:SMP-30/Gluconolactonase/LRE-like region